MEVLASSTSRDRQAVVSGGGINVSDRLAPTDAVNAIDLTADDEHSTTSSTPPPSLQLNLEPIGVNLTSDVIDMTFSSDSEGESDEGGDNNRPKSAQHYEDFWDSVDLDALPSSSGHSTFAFSESKITKAEKKKSAEGLRKRKKRTTNKRDEQEAGATTATIQNGSKRQALSPSHGRNIGDTKIRQEHVASDRRNETIRRGKNWKANKKENRKRKRRKRTKHPHLGRIKRDKKYHSPAKRKSSTPPPRKKRTNVGNEGRRRSGWLVADSTPEKRRDRAVGIVQSTLNSQSSSFATSTGESRQPPHSQRSNDPEGLIHVKALPAHMDDYHLSWTFLESNGFVHARVENDTASQGNELVGYIQFDCALNALAAMATAQAQGLPWADRMALSNVGSTGKAGNEEIRTRHAQPNVARKVNSRLLEAVNGDKQQPDCKSPVQASVKRSLSGEPVKVAHVEPQIQQNSDMQHEANASARKEDGGNEKMRQKRHVESNLSAKRQLEAKKDKGTVNNDETELSGAIKHKGPPQNENCTVDDMEQRIEATKTEAQVLEPVAVNRKECTAPSSLPKDKLDAVTSKPNLNSGARSACDHLTERKVHRVQGRLGSERNPDSIRKTPKTTTSDDNDERVRREQEGDGLQTQRTPKIVIEISNDEDSSASFDTVAKAKDPGSRKPNSNNMGEVGASNQELPKKIVIDLSESGNNNDCSVASVQANNSSFEKPKTTQQKPLRSFCSDTNRTLKPTETSKEWKPARGTGRFRTQDNGYVGRKPAPTKKKAPEVNFVFSNAKFRTSVDFSYCFSQSDALKEQERLFREARERVVKARSEAKCGPPVFTRVVEDVRKLRPDHWKWPDPYARLGLPRGCSTAWVKKQYRKLALIYHPDKSKLADTSTRFQAVTEAYKLLTRN